MITKQFTYSYFQPEEYHFSLDSVEMPFRVTNEFYQKDISDFKILDLCAGCGIIGFEFHYYFPQIKQLDFVEVQERYSSYFQKNLETVKSKNQNSKTEFRWLQMNYNKLLCLEFVNQYDLILANPPFFVQDQGKSSPSNFKNRCRFFMDSDFETLIQVMTRVLKPGGNSFFLLRSLSEHKKNLNLILEKKVQTLAQVQVLDFIRGTQLIKLKKYQ